MLNPCPPPLVSLFGAGHTSTLDLHSPFSYFHVVAVSSDHPLCGPPSWERVEAICSRNDIFQEFIADVIRTKRQDFAYHPYSWSYTTCLHTRVPGLSFLIRISRKYDTSLESGHTARKIPNTITSSVNAVRQMVPPAYPAIPPLVKHI